MAATITKHFWNGSEYKDITKIVFTSPNFNSPSIAGTRSHIQPGSQYIGTWYESVDFMYIQKNDQNYFDRKNSMESFFGLLELREDFDLDRESILPFDYCDIKHYCSNEIDIFMLTEGYVEESECIGIYYVPLKTIGLANIEGRNIDQFSAILLFLKSKNEDTIDDVWECTPSSDTKLAIINFLRNLNLR